MIHTPHNLFVACVAQPTILAILSLKSSVLINLYFEYVINSRLHTTQDLDGKLTDFVVFAVSVGPPDAMLFSLDIPPFNRSTSSYTKSSSVHKYKSQIVAIVTQINYSDEILPPNIQTVTNEVHKRRKLK